MLNKTQLIGHLGQDPELRHTQDGTAVVNLTLATSERWKDKAGQRQERTEWHRVVLFGRTAEVAAEYLNKGALLYVEGRLQSRQWQDDAGAQRQATEVIAERMKMLGGKGDKATTAPAAADAFDDDLPF
jgi:single-strand DNA-binding protein